MPLREGVRCLAAQIFLGNLLIELDAVGSVLCHGPSSPESSAAGLIAQSHSVRSERPTP